MTSRAATALSNDSCGDDGEAVCLKNQVGFLSHPPRDRRGCFLGLRSLPQGSAGACRSCRDTGRHGASHPPGQGKGSGSSWTQIPSPFLPLGPHCPALGVPGPFSGKASLVLASRSATATCVRLFPLTSGHRRRNQTFAQDSQTCSSQASRESSGQS